ncbi:SdpI family protein [Furfurilactobacillus cerevisiae]|uniref:SdpI family protein n=1 Tax=Furfurilactobacillus rossiae TaxID=231049 RepID=UPI003B9816B3
MRKLLQKRASFITLIVIYGLLAIFLLFRSTKQTLLPLMGILVIGAALTSIGAIWMDNHQTNFAKGLEVPTNYTLSFDLLLLIFAIWPSFLKPSLATGIGILFFLIGVGSLFIPQNHLMGIRIPPTYRSPEMWHKVNYFGGWLLAVAGYSIIIFGNLWPANTATIMLTTVIIAVVLTVGYAYLPSQPKTPQR